MARDERSTWASRSACARGHGRTSRPAREAAGWTAHAALVDHRATVSELGALVLENRLIKRLRPPGNRNLKHGGSLVLHPLPPGHPVPGARGARASPRPAWPFRSGPCGGGPVPTSWSSSSTRCSRCVAADAACRAAPPVGLRADGSLPVALPRRPGPQPVSPSPRWRAGRVRCARRGRARRCWLTSERRDAPGRRRPALRARRRPAPAPPAAGRAARASGRCPERGCTPALGLVLAPGPEGQGCDAFWLVGRPGRRLGQPPGPRRSCASAPRWPWVRARRAALRSRSRPTRSTRCGSSPPGWRRIPAPRRWTWSRCPGHDALAELAGQRWGAPALRTAARPARR